MEKINQVPPPILGLGALLVMLGAAIIRGWIGAVLIGLLVLTLAWLAYLTWARLTKIERLMRFATLFLLTALAVVFAVGG